MKTLLLAGLLAGFAPALPTFAEPVLVIPLTDNTPEAVKATIVRLYPTAKKLTFEKEKNDYEASFTDNGKAMSVVLDATGKVKETETEITASALPPAVRSYIAKRMPGKKIKEAAEIVDAQGVKTYEAEVGGKDLLFDSMGKPLN